MSRLLSSGSLMSALLGVAALAAAQPPPVFRVGLDLVNVTVTVRDGDGNLVSDLTADDFVVLEDGRPQKLQVFAPAVRPGQEDTLALNLGMLMDTSESMKEQIRLSQESAIRFLETIPRARDLILIFFDQDMRISHYMSENQQGIFSRILEMQGSGNTALYDAITVYLSRVAESNGRKVLVLFSDGEDTTSVVSLGEVLQLVRSSAVTIYPIAFTGHFTMGSNRYISARAFLHNLAELSGGQIFMPTASRDLAEVYEQILDELSKQYVLGYVSDNPARDGRFRKLKVEVRGGELKVRHRKGYTAPTSAR